MQMYAVLVVESGDSMDSRGFTLLPEEGFLLTVLGAKNLPTLEQLDAQFGEQLMPHFYTVGRDIRIESGSIIPLHGYTHKAIMSNSKNWQLESSVNLSKPDNCRRKYISSREKMIALEEQFKQQKNEKTEKEESVVVGTAKVAKEVTIHTVTDKPTTNK